MIARTDKRKKKRCDEKCVLRTGIRQLYDLYSNLYLFIQQNSPY